jgi:polyisoprenoid-binding protein YceI
LKTRDLKKTKWDIDATYSKIGFHIKYLVEATASGLFTQYNASIYTIGEGFATSEITVCINAASVHTGDAQRDAHLRGSDFFDVTSFTEISFVGSNFQLGATADCYLLVGDLTIKGITNSIQLHVARNGMVRNATGIHKAMLTVTGCISRKSWGLSWDATLNGSRFVLSDDVAIVAEIRLSRMLATLPNGVADRLGLPPVTPIGA